MRAPGFWWREKGLLATVLRPLGWIWQQETARRLRIAGESVEVPVICIGNLTVGGTGKTPVVIALLERLTGMGVKVHALSRGYGGELTGPLAVDPRHHNARQVGDEPLLLAAFAPTWIAQNRAEGARAAVAAGAEIIVMDDGFQNPSLTKDLSVIVVDAATGFGNGCIVPAGPLREPVAAGLHRADMIALIGDTGARAAFRSVQSVDVPVIEAELAPLKTGMDWQGLRVLAFAGIGRPEKFFTTLEGLGAKIVAEEAFDDHAPYTPALLSRLERDAKKSHLQLVTTEKDSVRLPQEYRQRILTLPVRLSIDDPSPLYAAIDDLIS